MLSFVAILKGMVTVPGTKWLKKLQQDSKSYLEDSEFLDLNHETNKLYLSLLILPNKLIRKARECKDPG